MKNTSMKAVKKIALLAALTASLSLAACSHENPIEKEPKAETLNFLTQASTYAENQLNFKTSRHGNMYGACMLGRVDDNPGFCDKLYTNMVQYAKKSTGSFQSLTLDDLKNEALFRKFYDLPER